MAESQAAVQARLRASPAVCTPHSAALTWGKWGLALVKSVGFHRVSRGAKIQTQPHAQPGFYLVLLHSAAEAFHPGQENPTSLPQPGGRAALKSLCQVSSCRCLPWQEADPTVQPVPRLVSELCSLLLPDQPSRAH